jgi:hypothetical protein
MAGKGGVLMAKKREKPPSPIVWKTGRGLSPLGPYDLEELDRFPLGTEFDLVARTKRSTPHNGLYWLALQKAVDATGRWNSREALHTALKVKMGMVEPIYDLKGNVSGMVPHSTAFEAMTQVEFNAYFTGAMALLSDAVGFDVLAREAA